jgi:tRNA dimethylallyltransferase
MRRVCPVLAIAGPTASGKSDLAVYLSETFGGEIVNYDSVQLYRRFDIGTAKPSIQEQRRVPHHLIDILEPHELFNAGEYQRRAREALDQIQERRRLPILVGGTGLYLRAVMEGLFEGPQRSEYWRCRLQAIAEERGRERLHAILKRLDPLSADRIAARDLPKVMRALEVLLASGKKLSRYLEENPRTPMEGFRFHILGLDPPRGELYARIGARVHKMFEAGLLQEVRNILESGIPSESPAFRGIGYRHVVAHMNGAMSLDEAAMLTERDTRRYAKRQMTWFRKQHPVAWFDGFGDTDDTKLRVHRFIDRSLNVSEFGGDRSDRERCYSD